METLDGPALQGTKVRHTPIALIGLPGSGKSSVAKRLGQLLDREVWHLDQVIESENKQSIVELFDRLGEKQFRYLESKVLERILSRESNAIIDGGGGLILRRSNRLILRSRATTIWLDAKSSVLVDRLGDARDRPLLAGEPIVRLAELRRERLGHYTSVADAIVNTDGLSAEQVTAKVVKVLETEPGAAAARLVTERVELDQGRSYPVRIGRGVVAGLRDLIPASASRVAIVTQEQIGIEVASGREQKVFFVEDGEGAKRLEVVGRLASQFATWGLTRSDVVVSVGGGVVSDLAGFVAATYHRGIPVIHVSTTLLGQIDAAIGGKCGVNLPEGKNLVGAYWQPTAVICDVDTLDTLSAREFRSGMGELAKYHFLGGGQLDQLNLVQRVAHSVQIKAKVVSGDEREGGRRAILNYGHTLAHALETAGSFNLRHGEAVGIGLVYAAEIALRLGRIDQARVDEHRRVVSAYGLETGLPSGFDFDELIDLFAKDKKALHGITFVLDGPDGVEPVIVEDHKLLSDSLTAIAH